MKTIRDRLHNWARWSRGGPAKSEHSMTGYICDRMRIAATGELASPTGTADRLDAVDAALVERAWRTLAPKQRELLRWHYIRGAAPSLICRRLGIKPRPSTVYDIEHAHAESAIAAAMRNLATPHFHERTP